MNHTTSTNSVKPNDVHVAVPRRAPKPVVAGWFAVAGLVCSSLAVSTLSNASASAQAPPVLPTEEQPASEATELEVDEQADVANPVAEAETDIDGIEVPELRTPTSTTFRRPDGSFETVVSELPPHLRDTQPEWEQAADGAWSISTTDGAIVAPAEADGEVTVSGPTGSVTSRFMAVNEAAAGDAAPGSVEVAAVEVAAVEYSQAAPGVALRLDRTPSGLKETVTLSDPDTVPGVLEWQLDTDSWVPELAGTAVVMRDADGVVAATVPAPFAVDAAGVMNDDLTVVLEPSGEGWVYRIELDEAWMADAGRVWPIEVDPSFFSAVSDCTLKEEPAPGSSRCGYPTLQVTGGTGTGTDRHALVDFDVEAALAPAAAYGPVQIQMAQLGLQDETLTTVGPIDAHVVLSDWDATATWTSPWSTPGGDIVADPIPAAGQGVTGADAFWPKPGWRYWHVTDAVQDWFDEPGTNEGLQLRAAPGATVDMSFHSNETTTSTSWPHVPQLSIVWSAGLGVEDYWSFEEFPLGVGRDLQVNVGNGNGIITDNDMAVAGVAGLDVGLTRTFNTADTAVGAYGPGWVGTSQKLRLYPNFGPDGRSHVEVVQPDGHRVTFLDDGTGTYVATSRVDATLTFDAHDPANQWDDRFEFRENESGRIWLFDRARLVGIEDRHGNLIDYRHNSNGLDYVEDTRNRKYTYSYGTNSKITKVAGPTGRDVTFGYDPSNRLTSVTNLQGDTTSYVWNGADQIVEIREPLDRTTLIDYVTSGDYTGRIASITRVDNPGAGTGPVTSFDYAADCSTIDAAFDSDACTVVTDPNGNTTELYVDAGARVTRVVDANGREQTNEYDADSNVTAYTPETGGTPITTTYSTDGANNVLSATAPTGATTSYDYNDLDNPYAPSQVTTPQGDNTLFDYDSSGRVQTVTDPDSNNTNIAYNANGTVDTVTDPNGGITDYTYNADVELVTIDSPGPLADVTFTYDSLSRVATTTDGNGVVTTFTYDNLDRATTIAAASGPTIGYSYDAIGNRSARTDAAGTYTTGYDGLNRITSEALSGSRNLSYVYDDAGNLTSLTDPAGTTTYVYNDVNLNTSLTTGTNTVTFTYDGRNRPDTTVFPNGVTVDSDYDISDRITARTVTGPGATAIEEWDWTYNNGTSDTALVQTATLDGATTSYSYDTLDRLTVANTAGGDSRSYTWDANHNRLTQTVNAATDSWTYNAANQITNTGYSYDNAGNRTAGGGTSLAYDPLNRTTTVGSAAATYLGAGQNEIDTFDSNTITRALPGLSNSGSYRYIRTPAGTPIGVDDGTDTYWLHSDRLGSITGITDNTGVEIVDYEYTPFGESTTTGTAAIKDQPVGYANGWTDRTTELINYGQRWYEPSTGTWTQADPAGTPDGPNRYTYVNGNPVNRIDPTGLFLDDFGDWAGLAGTALSAAGLGLALATGPVGVAGWVGVGIAFGGTATGVAGVSYDAFVEG